MTRWLFMLLLFCAQTTFAANNSFKMPLSDYLNGRAIVVPPGNRNSAARDYSQSKYQSVLSLISKKSNVCTIKEASELYGVSPIAIMGSIIGEHTYNVDAWDIAQDNYMYMVHRWISRFENNGIDLNILLQESEYAACQTRTNNNYDLWDCYNSIWHKDRRNPVRNKDIKWTFFNPVGSGYTYGFGQLGPERALMVADIVSETSGLPLLTVDNPPAIYDAILNPETSIHYVAATNRIAIDIYKSVANFDISQNPGIITTLYNLGREMDKADTLYNKTVQNLKAGKATNYPEVNYYGWFINSKADEILATYENAIKRARCN